jgi:hypothetical protein
VGRDVACGLGAGKAGRGGIVSDVWVRGICIARIFDYVQAIGPKATAKEAHEGSMEQPT